MLIETCIKPPRPDEINTKTGFKTILELGEEGYSIHSLVKVPGEIPSRLIYQKPAKGILVELIPLNQNLWGVKGKLGSDTIENLGLSVSRPRRVAIPSLVLEPDLEKIREFGTISRIDNQSHFEINIIIPVENIDHFLKEIWHPQIPLDIPLENARFCLRLKKRARILPQKTITDKLNPKRESSLIIDLIR